MAIFRTTSSPLAKTTLRQELVKAIANIEKSEISLTNQFISLNQWNY